MTEQAEDHEGRAQTMAEALRQIGFSMFNEPVYFAAGTMLTPSGGLIEFAWDDHYAVRVS